MKGTLMENAVYQTAFDQMVNTEHSQMLKAMIPFLPSNIQPFFVAFNNFNVAESILYDFGFFAAFFPPFN